MKSNESIDLSSFGIEGNKTTTPLNDREQMLIDTIAAVIAFKESTALQPQNHSFAAVQSKISSRYTRRFSPWSLLLSASGWAAAAAVTLFFTYQRTSDEDKSTVAYRGTERTGHSAEKPTSPASDSTHYEEIETVQKEAAEPNKVAATEKTKLEQRSLIQEIETLRLTISHLQKRDSERLTPTTGVTWPLIIKMTRPGEEDAVIASNNHLLYSILNDPDALTAARQPDSAIAIQPKDPLSPPIAGADATTASAIPIYDPARDKGQLIVNNLPAVDENQTYYLWVKTAQSTNPFLVGTLPKNINTNSETFDFRLGTTGIIPDSFQITLNGSQNPTLPQSSNIILQGPAKEK